MSPELMPLLQEKSPCCRVAAKFALAAMESAALNVEVNLAYIRDESYDEECRKEMAPMLEAGTRLAGEVWDKVNQRVKGDAK